MTASIPALLRDVSIGLDRPLVDVTGLEGEYDIDLTFGLDDQSRSADRNSLFAALEKQLGLKAEARRNPVKVLVIDHVERVPSEN
jgi:uncharacterized protein (TIGR03435 family)